MFETLREDIRCFLERDPASRNAFEIITCFPGLHAIWVHRLTHRLWGWKLRWLARFIGYLAQIITAIDIHPGAQIGRRLFIDHGTGIVIGETSVLADDISLYQGVTLGGTSWEKVKRHPTLESGVIVGAGAKILGSFTVGKMPASAPTPSSPMRSRRGRLSSASPVTSSTSLMRTEPKDPSVPTPRIPVDRTGPTSKPPKILRATAKNWRSASLCWKSG